MYVLLSAYIRVHGYVCACVCMDMHVYLCMSMYVRMGTNFFVRELFEYCSLYVSVLLCVS
jgi:hypothetical protein